LLDACFALLIFFIVFLFNLPFAAAQFLSPDATLYLDAARNLANGHGAVVSFNHYQLWQGAYYPLWPYVQPLFPVLAAPFFKSGGVSAVITLNIFLLALNCSLVYFLVRRGAGVLAGLIAALIVGFSYNIVYTAIYPWTEQLFIFVTLLAFYFYVYGRNKYFLSGVLLGVSCLVRAAGFFNGLAFFAAILIVEAINGKKFSNCFKFAAGFLSIATGYEIFCLLKYHLFYPEYTRAGFIFNDASYFPGAWYTGGKGALHALPRTMPMRMRIREFFINDESFAYSFKVVSFLIILPVFYFFSRLWKKRDALVSILFFTGCISASFAVMWGWVQPIGQIIGLDFIRLLVIPYLLLVVAGATFIFKLDDLTCGVSGRNGLRIFTIFAAGLTIFIVLSDYTTFRHIFNDEAQQLSVQRLASRPVYAWLGKNSPDESLIAVQSPDEAIFVNRPTVVLPSGELLTAGNIRDFLRIYNPAYVLATNPKFILLCYQYNFDVCARSGDLVLMRKLP
jgi:hypothetical protein